MTKKKHQQFSKLTKQISVKVARIEENAKASAHGRSTQDGGQAQRQSESVGNRRVGNRREVGAPKADPPAERPIQPCPHCGSDTWKRAWVNAARRTVCDTCAGEPSAAPSTNPLQQEIVDFIAELREIRAMQLKAGEFYRHLAAKQADLPAADAKVLRDNLPELYVADEPAPPHEETDAEIDARPQMCFQFECECCRVAKAVMEAQRAALAASQFQLFASQQHAKMEEERAEKAETDLALARTDRQQAETDLAASNAALYKFESKSPNELVPHCRFPEGCDIHGSPDICAAHWQSRLERWKAESSR